MNSSKVFTLSEVSHHKTGTDCWFIINGKVLDVTKFLEDHPGGDGILIEWGGKDATKVFEDIGHSKSAKEMIVKYQIGYLHGYELEEKDDHDDDHIYKEPVKKKEMTAFVIKEDPRFKYATILEFFVPLFVSGGFMAYRYFSPSF
ncbi:cytochrome b5-like [Impatiens glandulifera]|uniref:cytochrome b5-like n=1 Tax=Impatiens glandulifera TaxID=253017 RepID=UPI001FB107FA|nr:cytochrome b5-like [Impatiens glandulifera]